MLKKMTNKDVISTVNRIIALQEREEKEGVKLIKDRIKVVYAIKKNKDKLEQLLKPFTDTRAELLAECNKAEANKNGTIDIKLDCVDRFNKEMTALLDIEVDAEIHTVKFSDIDGLELSMNDLEAIDFMIEEPDSI
jgi:hypothetical protein